MMVGLTIWIALMQVILTIVMKKRMKASNTQDRILPRDKETLQMNTIGQKSFDKNDPTSLNI